ncbi:hypothetical protein [Sigmofec virus UA08Rod_4626]|uniref:Uncharacterized protein n=1 Tax=Sigmofec virus UA08Rod_4626 TaxID=2929405 RepID=A0A976R720_9VIRU|nr:hypothetical protein [Sigmofec virus UA08Rod_4626]
MFNEIVKRRNRPIPMFESKDDPVVPVVNDLAVTPSDMHQMTARGVPISAQNESMFYDGDTLSSIELDLEYQRGIDVVDLWDAEKTSRLNILKLRNRVKDSSN